MRKISILLTVVFLLSMILSVSVSAANTATLTGPSTVRAGDTITLTFTVKGTGIEGGQGTLSYDSNQVTLSSTKQVISSPWVIEFSGNNMVAYDNEMSKPISKETKLFTATFKVNSKLAEGTSVTISVKDTALSDGSNETKVGTVSYTTKIAKPLSGDCTLKSLTVSNATISPAFNTNTTEYTADVPYETSKLNINAVANDSNSKVTVDSPTLTVNGTTQVTITVKAQTGATKTYTITVTRAQDPNYVASTEAGLSNITINGFYISPVFSTDNDKYVVYLPYETSSLSITATNVDSKGTYRVEGNTDLTVGDNTVKVIGIAEDGTTEKVYTITAKRAAEYNGNESETTGTEPIVTEPEVTEPEMTTSDETTEAITTETDAVTTETNTDKTDDKTDDNQSSSINIILPVIAAGIGIVIGFIVGKVTKRK